MMVFRCTRINNDATMSCIQVSFCLFKVSFNGWINVLPLAVDYMYSLCCADCAVLCCVVMCCPAVTDTLVTTLIGQE